MHREFLEFVKLTAKQGGFEPEDTCAIFNLTHDSEKRGALPGAVYGIAAILDDAHAGALEREAQYKKSLKTPLIRIRKINLGAEVAIPLYWGKDAAVGYRLYRHLLDKTPKAGCLGVRFYKGLANTDLLVASLPVTDFVGFERYVEAQFPPMLYNVKTSNIGLFCC